MPTGAVRPARRRWFRIHVVSFVLGAAVVALGFGNAWPWAVTLGGLLVASSGAAAVAARRSVLMSLPVRTIADEATRDETRAQTERANAWMSGLALAALGSAVAVLGAMAWLG